MSLRIKHGAGLEGMAMAYGAESQRAYEAWLREEEKKAKKKASRKKLVNTAVMGGLGAAAVATPFVLPAMLGAGAGAGAAPTTLGGLGAAATEGASAGYSVASAGMSSSQIASTTMAVSGGLGLMGSVYSQLTPAEERSAIGGALMAGGSGFGNIMANQQMRESDAMQHIQSQQEMILFRNGLQMENQKRLMVEKSEFDFNELQGLHAKRNAIQKQIDDGKLDNQTLGAAKSFLTMTDRKIRELEVGNTRQVSYNANGLSPEDNLIGGKINELTMEMAKSQDDPAMVAQIQTQLTPWVSEFEKRLDSIVSEDGKIQAMQLAKQSFKDDWMKNKTKWYLPRGVENQQYETWLKTPEGKTAIYKRSMQILAAQQGVSLP